ncbi:hypothetical protein ASD74_05965 [Rhizobium sp. Root564]|nr:hypothetical protein ASD74_05965 [Rhizobium sp. Root564]
MQSEKLAELLQQYFELGVAEGREGRNHDTKAGDAQRVLSAIESEIAALSTEAKPSEPGDDAAAWVMIDLEKGKNYESVHFGLVEYVGRDVFHGQTTAKFDTCRRDVCRFQYVLPEKLGAFLKPKARALSAVDGADIGGCIRSLSVEHPLKWAEAEKTPILRGWFVGQVMKHFDGKPDEKHVRELIDLVFAMYPSSPASKQGIAE